MRLSIGSFLHAARAIAAIIGHAGVLSLAAADRPPASTNGARPVDFINEIQPLFSQHCANCHGQEKQRSSYRLDNRSIAIGGGESGHTAIVPGRSQDSRLFQMVSGQLPDLRMPPKGDPLSAAQLDLVQRWIDQGAVWPDSANHVLQDPLDWWSLKPLLRPEIPSTSDSKDTHAAPVHPVDAFIQSRLRSAGLQPAPEADRRTLIRRLYFDLLGLPPSPEEVQAFIADPDPNAYEHCVDRLLASPHFGERWARQWLDIVHYGDTHGYDKDKPRPNAWPYRDYVIRAFNEDKPYERFVQEQLAGDVMHPNTADGIEALGFIAAGPWDLIGHEEVPESKIDGKIARHLDRDDMVANTIGTFASTTVHCAQCHDHKFDPIKQEDYYRLQAVFAAVDRADRRYYREPELNARRSGLELEIRSLRHRETELKSSVATHGGDGLRTANERLSAAEKSARDGQPAEYGYHSAIATRPDETKWVQVDLGKSIDLERVVLRPCRDQFNNIGDGFGFPVRYRVETAATPDFNEDRHVVADLTSSDVPNPGLQAPSHAAKVSARYVRVTATRLAPRQNDFIFALAELEVFDARGTNVARATPVTALDSIEAPERWRKENLTDGKAPKSSPSADETQDLRRERDQLVSRLVPSEILASLAATTNRLAEARRELDRMPAPLVAYVGAVHDGSGNFRGTGPDNGQPRPIHVLTRGDVTKPLKPVSPGALRCVSSLVEFPTQPDHPEGDRRAALARWLTDPQNPLTWRSIANRIWQHHFGRGLVDTPNDFGHMGSLPSHPELLDWLAVEFRDGGQSFKTMARLLVTSATYRQASAASQPDARTKDADNRLLSRMNLRRLDAEAIRDSILAVSGKLDQHLFGPGFQDFVVEKPEHSPHYQYHLHDAEDLRSHRRSIYRFLVRSQQEPFMVALDCADPSMRVDRRSETLTPLQALALLNSQLTIAMSRHFAQRVVADTGQDDINAQVRRAFHLAVQRPPTGAEASDIATYCRAHGLPATCRLLFNLNEFVYVD
ncbi:MAG: DUF1553 domain-containing protein [Verrucomicrobiales bacterium]|nr:DUF1553 domain-containing protein [Verrucomicrobiales bacterium]